MMMWVLMHTAKSTNVTGARGENESSESNLGVCFKRLLGWDGRRNNDRNDNNEATSQP